MKKTIQPVRKTENADVVAAGPLAATGVEKMILVIRDKQVLLDRDLATLYGVETRRINEQVKPLEYMFLRSQMGMRTNSWTQLEAGASICPMYLRNRA